MYQLKRSEKIRDELELCNECGEPAERLGFVVDIDVIAADLRRRMNEITSAEQALKRAVNDGEYGAAYEQYGRAVRGVVALCMGEDNAEKICRHFENNWIELSVAVVPYIYDVILPRVNECLSRRREQLKNIYKGRKHK